MQLPPNGAASDGSALTAWFERLSAVTVAFSGGVDSSLVLAAATRALGPDRVHAVTAVSPSVPRGTVEAAGQFAAAQGVAHRQVRTREMELAEYRANNADRCYFCKSTLVDTIRAIEPAPGFEVLVTGTNSDDVRQGWRPGIRAAAERGARTPLVDCGLTKDRVRAVSRAWDLPTWNIPASPCLSSRVAYGVQITDARLARIDRAERAVRAAVRQAGVPVFDLRVRDLGDTARIEVDADAVERVAGLPELATALSDSGFDAAGYEVLAFHSGALNAVLDPALRFG